MDWGVVVPWIGMLLTIAALVFGRQDKGKEFENAMRESNAVIRMDITEIKTTLKNMNKERDDQEEMITDIRKRNSESHKALHEKCDKYKRESDARNDELEKRIAALEYKYNTLHESTS